MSTLHADDEEKNIGLDHGTEPGPVGDNDRNYIVIGRKKVRIEDVMEAFGGTLNPGRAAASPYQFANPSPLGLCGFALTTFCLSIVNFNGQGVQSPAIVIGLAYFYGGVIQLCAGMWEMAVGNTFAATALSSYGGFWLSWAAIETEAFGIASAYSAEDGSLGNAVGFYLLGWTIFTAGLTLCTVKATLPFFALFFLLTITFLLLALGNFLDSAGCTKAGGVVGLIVSVIAWYNAFAGIATKENSYVTVRPIPLPGSTKWKRKFSSKHD